LVVGPPSETCENVASWLRDDGHGAVVLDSQDWLEEPPNTSNPHVVLYVSDGHAVDDATLDRLLESHPMVTPILLAADDGERLPKPVMNRFFDVLEAPVDRKRLTSSIRQAVRQARLSRDLTRLTSEERRGGPVRNLIGSAPAMVALYDQLERVVATEVPVFLHGESGTGKELIARAVHDAGPRRTRPFVALNCAAIPEGLQESELFGHERGAFTGATTTSPGRFEQAHGGTLFLDEIGDIHPSVQAKLLRVLQEGTFYRVGGSKKIKVDVRVISATHRDIESMTRSGSFREDLYYRVVVYPIRVPPLRERREDVPQLILHFLSKHAAEVAGKIKPVDPDALDLLCSYQWPGNVRELENVVRRAALASNDVIRIASLPGSLTRDRTVPLPDRAPSSAESGSAEEIISLAELERRAIVRALELTGGNLAESARRLGIGRATLYRKLASYEKT